MTKLKAAVIGVGYLGDFHAEKYHQLDDVELLGVVDVDEKRAKKIAKKTKSTAYSSYHDIIDQVDMVSIVVPTQLHFNVAKDFITHGVHVLIEKPITVTLEEADQLIALAKENKVTLQVGLLERFNPVVVSLRDVVSNPMFIESNRIAPFNTRGSDVNVMLDLMIHDIDIIQSFVKSPIKSIDANGIKVLSDKTDIANARITFENHCVANVTASRISLKSERKMRIFQSNAYFSVDLQDKKAMIYRRGDGEMFPGIPNFAHEKKSFGKGDALLEEIKAFVSAVINKTQPAVTGDDGKRSLQTAIQITEMVRSHPHWKMISS